MKSCSAPLSPPARPAPLRSALTVFATACLLSCGASDRGAPVAAAPPPAAPPAGPDASPAPPVVHVQILAINDFHGNVEPPSGTNGVVLASPADPIAKLPGTRLVADGGVALVPAGGAEFLAAQLSALRARNPDTTIVVSAGDLTGASPLLSNLLNDEPTVAVMNVLGLDYEAVGNHDLDRGIAELARLARGGCDGGACDRDGSDAGAWTGATFGYLAANVLDAAGKPVFPAYAVRELTEGGARVKVGFIGETLKGTPGIASASAVKGLTFTDEATTANALVPELKRQGVSAIVLVLHQGAQQAPEGTYDSCVGLSGDLLPILDRLDPAIDVVVSGHTHQAYDCTIGGRLVTSAMSYGRLVTEIHLTIDAASGRVLAKTARNVPVTRDVPPDPAVSRMVAGYAAESAARTGRIVGWVRADFTGNARAAGSASCETPLGDLIADAQRDATGADLALMNPGGIRADLVAKRAGRPEHAITYADAFEVQPFGNDLVTMSITGAQLQTLLEAQFGSRSEPRILQVSSGFSYAYVYDRAHNTGKVTGLTLHGVPIDPSKRYRVTVNSFLAGGGDSFKVLKDGTDLKPWGHDVDALVDFLGKNSSERRPLSPSPLRRITGDGCR